MNASTVKTAVTEVQVIGDEILKTVAALDPQASLPAGVAVTVLDLAAEMIGKAIDAYNSASGVVIDKDSVLALLPNATPLTAPDA